MSTLIVFSHLRWGFVYQRPQHLLSRLAEHHRVVFVEEPVRTDGPARLESIAHSPTLQVLVPHTPVEAPGFHDDQLPVLRPLLDAFLSEQRIDDYDVWFYTPMALPLITRMRPRLVVYDCMDELAAFKGAPLQLRQRETALLKAADLVLTGGPSLYEAKRSLNPNVHLLASAVDAAHFRPRAADAVDPDADALQAGLPRPRLGFFGVVDERMDLRLLETLASSRPDWQIVMVGPVVKIDPRTLPRNGNIHWLGMQPYALLPHLMAGWDVCLMPFALNGATRYISPTKTLEYLAGEKPVVSTAVPDVVLLYGDVVKVARSPSEFVDACADCLDESPAQREQRLARTVATVMRSSWDEHAAFVHASLVAARRASEPVLEPAPEKLVRAG